MADLLNVFEQTILFENALPLPMRIDATQGGNYTKEKPMTAIV